VYLQVKNAKLWVGITVPVALVLSEIHVLLMTFVTFTEDDPLSELRWWSYNCTLEQSCGIEWVFNCCS